MEGHEIRPNGPYVGIGSGGVGRRFAMLSFAGVHGYYRGVQSHHY